MNQSNESDSETNLANLYAYVAPLWQYLRQKGWTRGPHADPPYMRDNNLKEKLHHSNTEKCHNWWWTELLATCECAEAAYSSRPDVTTASFATVRHETDLLHWTTMSESTIHPTPVIYQGGLGGSDITVMLTCGRLRSGRQSFCSCLWTNTLGEKPQNK